MRNLVFFITHKTLPLTHADAVFYSISKQAVRDGKKFDVLYLYNTHSDELPNEELLSLYEKYDLQRFFGEVKIFPYDNNTHKSVGGDVEAIRNYAIANYAPEDRFLMLKSDSVISKNYFDDILHLDPNRPVYFVAPFINAKERVTDAEIFEYVARDQYVKSDEITFFVEDTESHLPTDFQTRPGCTVTDPQFKFTSCYVCHDFSAHFLSVSLARLIRINKQSWGGVSFRPLMSNLIKTDRSFVVHKYHDIVSENRDRDREGPAPIWLRS